MAWPTIDISGGSITPHGRLAETWASVDLDDLSAWIRDRVPPYAVPVVIRPVGAIPQTSTFKPHRAEIQRLLQNG